MANRYWVGGTDTWDGTAGTKWSTTSGGAGGSAVPTTSDAVFFDANSGANTITIGSGAVCSTISWSGFTGTVAFGTNSIQAAGSGATIFTGATTCSVTGAPVINCTYSGSTGTRTISPGNGVTEANSVSFNITAGSDTITITTNHSLRSLDFTGFTGTFSANSHAFYGDLILNSGMTSTDGAVTQTFAATSGTQKITSNGVTLGGSLTVNAPGATVQLQDAITLNSNRTFSAFQGTLDLYSKTLTTGIFSSTGSGVRTIAYGTGNITVTGNNAAVFAVTTIANVTITGTPVVNFTYSGSTGTRTIASGAVPEAQAPTLNITAGSDIIALTTGGTVKDYNFTGFSGTYTPTVAAAIYGNLTLSSSMTISSVASSFSFVSASSIQTITTNGVTVNCPINIGATGTTNTLRTNGAVTIDSTHTLTITSGTLDLTNNGAGNYTFTAGLFSSSQVNVRSIKFGTAQIYLTGSDTSIIQINNARNFTYTGTPNFNLTYSGSTGTRTVNFGGTSFDGESQTINVNVTAGSDSVVLQYSLKSIDLTGFSGTWVNNSNVSIYGNLLVSSGTTVGSGAFILTFNSAVAEQNITTNGKTLDFPIYFYGTAGSKLIDNLTVGSTRSVRLWGGTLNVNGKTLSCGSFSATSLAGSATSKTLAMGSNGTLTVVAGDFNAGTAPTSLIVTGTGTINMTYNLSKAFAGGNGSYPVLNQGGSGTLVVQNSNSFTDITNTVQPATIQFTSGTTQTVSAFSASGTAGNLITLQASVGGSQATLSRVTGTTNVNYCSITDINATGGATWIALTSNGNVDGGDNTGWYFTVAPSGTTKTVLFTRRKTKRYFI